MNKSAVRRLTIFIGKFAGKITTYMYRVNIENLNLFFGFLMLVFLLWSSLDPEILNLCDELESLGGGINTRIEPIQA